jgi:O-antigen ligase
MAVTFPIFMNAYKKSNSNIDELLVTLILITLPLGGYAINSIFVILFFLLSVYRFFTSKPSIVFSKIPFLFIAFYFFGVLSLLWTDSVKNTFEGLIRFLSYLVLPLAFMINAENRFSIDKIFERFSKSMVFFALYCLIIGFIKVFKYDDINFLFYHELSGNLSQLNAIYLSVFISLAIGFFLFKSEKSKATLFYAIFLGVFLVLLSSKIIISMTFIFSIWYFFKNNFFKKGKPIHFITVIVMSFIFMISSINFVNRFKTEFEKTKINEVLETKDFGPVYLWTGVGLRVFQTKAFIEILTEKKRIFLGSGLNNSQEDLNNKYKEYNLYSGFLNYNYHNQYIQIFAELGFVGLTLFLMILFIILKEAINNKNYFLFSFIIITSAVCITETFLWRQRGMVFFIIISLLLSRSKKLST